MLRFVLLACLAAAVSAQSVADVFGASGKAEGLQIWRVENFTPVPTPAGDYGKFHEGDSYIVLQTSRDPETEKLKWDIYFWLGKDTTQDEAGSAAIFTVQLDDFLGGEPVQHREVQGEETPEFLALFNGAISILPGGVESGFRKVETNAGGDLRLFQVKGNKNVQVKQVPANVSSMNKGDCFVLDTGKGEVLVYVGAESRLAEKTRATLAANNIRDQDHAGRATVTIIDQFNAPEDIEAFFKALGSGSASQVLDASVGGSDE